MNERIKELAFLAAKETNSNFNCDAVWMNKFAELIVHKCQTLIEEESNKWRGEEDITNFKLAIAAINEYFSN